MRRAQRFWERPLMPAFVYFVAKLYPFRWVADPRRGTAGTAGGCLLVRWSALQRAGGCPQAQGHGRPGCSDLGPDVGLLSAHVAPVPAVGLVSAAVGRGPLFYCSPSPRRSAGTGGGG